MNQAGPNSRFLVPPVYFLVALLLMVFFHRVAPWAQILEAPYRYAGIVLAALALGLGAWAAVLFRRVGTDIRPFMPSTALVVAGPYKLTRNPMYLGMVLALCGIAMLFGTLTPWLVIPLFAWWIDRRFIAQEEVMLEEHFGADYLEFKKRVRRWI